MAKTIHNASLTDAQVIEKAWKIIQHSNVKENLPPRYTLRQLHEASLKIQQLGAQFIDRYGDRLKELDSAAFNELNDWKEML